jgi:hypothetical protein
MLTTEQTVTATTEALAEIARSPTGNLRSYLQGWMLTTFADPQRSEWWGEATDVCLIQEVRDASLAALREDAVQKAFAADKQMWRDTQDASGIQDNPWVLFDSSLRKQALADRMKVIALSNGGTGYEACPEEPIGYVESHQLAEAARTWLASGKTAADVDMQANSDDIFYMRLAMQHYAIEETAIAAGTFKGPGAIQREIQVAKFMAREAAGD